MRRHLIMGGVAGVTVCIWLIVAASALAGSQPVAGARPAASREAAGSVEAKATAQATPLFFVDEVTAAFTATPTIGSLGDAVAASRNAFGFTEPIEFNAVLFKSGQAGSFADLQLFVFDQTSGRHILTTPLIPAQAPDDLTGFFIQLDPGTLPVGQLKWLMAIFHPFETFITPLQALKVQ